MAPASILMLSIIHVEERTEDAQLLLRAWQYDTIMFTKAVLLWFGRSIIY